MTWSKSYGHFAASYGTCWLIVIGIAVVTQSHIDTGEVGLWGFPIVGIVYMLIRRASTSDGDRDRETEELRARVKRLEDRMAKDRQSAPPPSDAAPR